MEGGASRLSPAGGRVVAAAAVFFLLTSARGADNRLIFSAGRIPRQAKRLCEPPNAWKAHFASAGASGLSAASGARLAGEARGAFRWRNPSQLGWAISSRI